VLSYCTINGIPVRQLIPQNRLDAIIQRTRDSGAEVVKLMGSSAYYAPASAAVQLARSYLYDEKRLLPCAAYLRANMAYTTSTWAYPRSSAARGWRR